MQLTFSTSFVDAIEYRLELHKAFDELLDRIDRLKLPFGPPKLELMVSPRYPDDDPAIQRRWLAVKFDVENKDYKRLLEDGTLMLGASEA